jgi:hypothetical protein
MGKSLAQEWPLPLLVLPVLLPVGLVLLLVVLEGLLLGWLLVEGRVFSVAW